MTDEAFDRGIDRWLMERVAGVAPCAAEYQESEGMMEMRDMRDMTSGEAEAYRRGKADAVERVCALIRAAGPMTLRILPTTPQGEVVVRDLREELAQRVEGLGA